MRFFSDWLILRIADNKLYSRLLMEFSMIGLILPGRKEKLLAFLGAIAVAILVLVQHIHYTIDVVGALVFTWLLFQLTGILVRDLTPDQNASPN
ncbi:MAG: hypothetical protein EB023_13095 [Flavobacteriia bacterium]|nr:hypothetical protein [Flavobacteriia bacterium]